ncbi:MAG: DNA repair exonuclease [Scytolyngbya sp. HA4215-MV1]|jgi:DNA repair exonuclease SbcCD nuclease subunit|nr:DNA repair exonuclease [Scytolyngbya sp. HA4215-MV1]
MPRFLHVSDVHLGFDKYDNKERTADFFWAFQDALERYAIAEQVDFVVLAGDLFEHRNIQPATLNQAQSCLKMLQEAGIPILAIEGNHDNRPYGTKTNWLRYLADWGLLILLEPENDPETGQLLYQPWDWEDKRGGYLDLACGVRVLGSSWYGSSAPRSIAALAEAIQRLPAGAPYTILLFHHGLEGQIARYQGALRYSDVLPLRQAGVDYLALGHIHKNYEVEGWIFNPGSVEANSIEESVYKRGVYLVQLDATGVHSTLKQDYRQRPTLRLQLVVRAQDSLEDLTRSAVAKVQQAMDAGQLNPDDSPIVELRITGQVGFDRLELDTRKLRLELQQLSHALIFLLKYEVDAVEYASPLAEEATRLQIEQEVFTDLLAANHTYRKQSRELSQGLIELKDLQLQGRSEAELYDFAQGLLNRAVMSLPDA